MKDNKLNKRKKIKSGIKLSTTKIGYNLENLKDTIRIGSEIANTLVLSIDKKGILDNYNIVLGSQKAITERVSELNINSKPFLSDILAPITSTLADIGLGTLNSQQKFSLGEMTVSVLKERQNISTACLDVLGGVQGSLLSMLEKNFDKRNFFTVDQSVIESTRMITGGLSELVSTTLDEKYKLNSPSLVVLRSEALPAEKEIKNYQKQLDEILDDINSALAGFRRGCWATFNSQNEDSIGQAASSMRRLVDTLLRTIAPDKKVKATKYFNENKDAVDDKGKPTRKARLYFILDYDSNPEERFDRLAKGFSAAYGNLTAWDHAPVKSKDFAHGAFVTIEGYLLCILSEFKKI